MSQRPPEPLSPHPFDVEDGPDVINYQGSRVAIRPPLNSQNVPLTKPQQDANQTTRREVDRIARQLEGLSKSLRQLKERV
jgi:hypothetical protein